MLAWALGERARASCRAVASCRTVAPASTRCTELVVYNAALLGTRALDLDRVSARCNSQPTALSSSAHGSVFARYWAGECNR